MQGDVAFEQVTAPAQSPVTVTPATSAARDSGSMTAAPGLTQSHPKHPPILPIVPTSAAAPTAKNPKPASMARIVISDDRTIAKGRERQATLPIGGSVPSSVTSGSPPLGPSVRLPGCDRRYARKGLNGEADVSATRQGQVVRTSRQARSRHAARAAVGNGRIAAHLGRGIVDPAAAALQERIGHRSAFRRAAGGATQPSRRGRHARRCANRPCSSDVAAT